MERGSVIMIFLGVAIICFLIYNSIPSKYTKLEENFGGFIYRGLVRFEYEKSPLNTIVDGGTGTDKTYFVRQYLNLYQDQDQDIKSIIIVCKDDRDWIDPETVEFHIGFNTCDINKIASKIRLNSRRVKLFWMILVIG